MSYARDHLIPLPDEGLGNSGYLARVGDRQALAAGAEKTSSAPPAAPDGTPPGLTLTGSARNRETATGKPPRAEG